ncbi:peptidase M19 [Halorubrum sp. JWXQ-INN 858]|uniref:dipeptidase n=1 Tax=Halorubrum sp. JWXQ-INN 858 TaxID=2690782 RepID=UPI0013570460|nr:membrane dipeptidase [Halorubrum sp. JWXQ-INN 858]MWV65066.1 peptidase M19 [Halorubrum sp. JWXQ-INN 858]
MAHTPTFDYFPRGTPLVVSDRIEAAMTDVLDAGGSAGAAYDAMEEAQVRQLRDDPAYRDELRGAYADAGVDLVSATMGSLDSTLRFPEGVRQDVLRWQARFDAVDWLHKVTTPAEAAAVVERGDVGVVMNVQNGGAAIDGDVAETTRLYNAGVRVVQLTYNDQNLVGVGCTERVDAGLSNHGVAFVEALDEHGMVVDLSHCGRATTLDAMDAASGPVAITHAFCGALADHDRAKSDAELEALAATDGYVGVLAVPFFLAPGESSPPFEVLFDHIDHAVDVVGIDRVGIGTDWGSWTPELPAPLHDGLLSAFESMGFREEHGVRIGTGFGPMQSYRDWGVIPEGLAERGYSEAEIEGIVGGNFLDFWERAV